MYNLLVSGWNEEWQGEPATFDLSRCVREYTEDAVRAKFATLDDAAISELLRLPCIFAYETYCELEPKFGYLTEITKRGNDVRLSYEFKPITPFLTWQDFTTMNFELGLSKWEMNRSHWAVKDINLPLELQRKGINLPQWTSALSQGVDIAKHHFNIALSFPGQDRGYVEEIAQHLERASGPHSYFYDNNYLPQLARPSLDLLLQDIYKNRSNLVVIFISGNYQNKSWCGVEWRAIRDIISARQHERIMLIKMDDGEVEGVFKNDGYIDGSRFTPSQVADFIQQRAQYLPTPS